MAKAELIPATKNRLAALQVTVDNDTLELRFTKAQLSQLLAGHVVDDVHIVQNDA